jgi:hypothetical protein
MNQNSQFGVDLDKVFFAPALKIVLQHYRPAPDSRTAKSSRRPFTYTIIGSACAEALVQKRLCRSACSFNEE